MNLVKPKIGANAGQNIATIILKKDIIWLVGIVFHIREVNPPFNPNNERIRANNFYITVAKIEGIFFIVVLVLFLTLSHNDF
jgi:hypothetical protein